jgi:hypothetical protein
MNQTKSELMEVLAENIAMLRWILVVVAILVMRSEDRCRNIKPRKHLELTCTARAIARSTQTPQFEASQVTRKISFQSFRC